MDNGFIKVWRKLRKNPIYTNSKAVHVWLECLMRASYQEKTFYKGREKIELDPGQFIMGREEFGDKIGMSGSTAWYWIKEFEADSMVDTESTAKGTIVTIENWGDYQKVDSNPDTTQTEDKQEINTNKNIKKEKNVKNNTNGGKFELTKKENGRYDYPDEFEEIWDTYPDNRGNKKKAWRKWKARRNDGIDNELLLEAAENYRIEIEHERTDKKYIKHGATFYGPDEHWRDYLDKNWNDPRPDKRPPKKYAPSIDDLIARGMSEEDAQKKREAWLEQNGY